MFGCTENQTQADEDETRIPRLTWLQPGRRARRTDRKTRRIRSLGRRMRRSTFVSLSRPSFRRNAASYQTGSRQTRGAGIAPQMILTDQQRRARCHSFVARGEREDVLTCCCRRFVVGEFNGPATGLHAAYHQPVSDSVVLMALPCRACIAAQIDKE